MGGVFCMLPRLGECGGGGGGGGSILLTRTTIPRTTLYQDHNKLVNQLIRSKLCSVGNVLLGKLPGYIHIY